MIKKGIIGFLFSLFSFTLLYGNDLFPPTEKNNLVAVNEKGYTPLAFAILTGRVEAVESLLPLFEKTKSLQGINGAFLKAVIKNNQAEIKRWLKEGASLEAKAESRQTALMISCYSDPTGRLTAWLLREGASIDAVDIAGRNALYYALVNQNWEAGAMLSAYGLTLPKGTQIEPVVSPFFLHRLNIAFLRAVESNADLNLLELFRKMGADLNWKGEQGKTALMIAVLDFKSPVLTEWLLDKGADPVVKDRFGRDLLSLLVENPSAFGQVKRLIASGAMKPYLTNSYPLLDRATRVPKNRQMVSLLLKNTTDFEARDRVKRTLLQNLLYYYDDFKAVYIRQLVQAGASVNSLDRDGQSVLLYAVRFCPDEKLIRWLIRQGADLEYCNPWGRNALLAALECAGEQTVWALLKAGAKVDVALPNGTTARELFYSRKFEERASFQKMEKYFKPN